MVRFTVETLLPVDAETAFDLSLSIDLHVASFSGSGERAVDGVQGGLIGLGEFVTWRARHFGVTWTMTNSITAWERPKRFVDEQSSGPFKSFRHEHVFEPAGRGTTRLTDHVEFEAPLGPLGRLAERLVLARYLRRLIEVRNAFLVTEATRQGRSQRRPAMTDPRPAVSYPFAFERPLDRWARLFAVVPSRSFVIVDDDGFEAIYGSWRVATVWSNVTDVERTGPYRWWKIAGPAHLSVADRGITMAATPSGGVCISVHEPVRGLDPLGVVRHPSVTLGVEDPDTFVRDVEQRRRRSRSRPGPPPIAPRHPKGRPLASLRAVWHWHRRSVVHDERVVERIALPANHRSEGADDQPPDQGTGPTVHRRYRVGVRNPALSAEAAMAAIQADPDLLADPRVAPFTKSVGTAGSMREGDRYVIQVFGPWNGAVEVIEVSPQSFRLATLEGHMESGVIEMRTADHEDHISFTIESWARSHDRFLRTLYERLRFAYALQSEMWATALDRFTELVGGEPTGPICVVTERATASARRATSSRV